MEEKADATDLDSVAGRHQLPDTPPALACTTPVRSAQHHRAALLLLALSFIGISSCAPKTHDSLAKVRASGRLVYGSDEEGAHPISIPTRKTRGRSPGSRSS